MSTSTKDLALTLIESSKAIDPGPESCISHFQEFATNPVTEVEQTHRLTASLLWLVSAKEHKHPSLLSAYTHLARLLERLPILGLDIWARKEVLDQLPTDLAISAARCALDLGDPELAVTLVDKYRGLSWGQILRTLAPEKEIDGLIQEYPNLGIPLRGYLGALFRGSMSHRARSLHTDPNITRQEIDAHMEIAKAADDLLVQIRELPGYQTFLEPDPLLNARRLARCGHVVMFVPDETCTHAIFLRKGESEVRSASVQGLNLEKINGMVESINRALGRIGLSARGVDVDALEDVPVEEPNERGVSIYPRVSQPQTAGQRLESILSTLWNTIGITLKEIFQLERNGDSKLYIYSAGPLSILPIHAACHSEESLLDYATPSYIPSLKNLAFPTDTPTQGLPHVLAISQPNTPGHSPLPCTTLEVAEIQKYIPPERIHLYERDKGNTLALLSHSYELARTKPLILHLACHAKHDPLDPFRSSFSLFDGQVSLSSLMWSQNKLPVLAVLSACETAGVDETRPDEFLHIGASMHCLKGFPSVVATLWAIHDMDGPSMAGSLYKGMFETGLDSAAALRAAINYMRSERVPPMRWVPFVHFGV